MLGVPFDHRGERADDALAALRSALYAARAVLRARTPIRWFARRPVRPAGAGAHLGGDGALRSLRRAAQSADGWCPFAVTSEQAALWLAQTEIPDGFEVRLAPPVPLDPLEEPAATADALGLLADAGATIVLANFVHHSLAHYLEQLRALVAVNAGL